MRSTEINQQLLSGSSLVEKLTNKREAKVYGAILEGRRDALGR